MAALNNVTVGRLLPSIRTRYIRVMPRTNILVVVIDGLRASALGAYGNTTFPTSALDRLATQSLVLDGCYAPAVELEDVYSALWQSRLVAWATTPIRFADDRVCPASFPRVFVENGYHTTLVTDEPQLFKFEGGQDFDDCVQVNDRNGKTALAVDLTETSLAQVFAAAGEVIERSHARIREASVSKEVRPQLVWLHTRGLFGPWDAPLSLQESLLDTEDPPPILSVTPPDFQLRNDDNPDLVFQYGVAYAAQVMVLDECWRSLTQLLPQSGAANEWLVLFLGGRGYCLGEHERIGGVDRHLPAEQLHVPWLTRFPDGAGQLARSPALVSHRDVIPTLLDWIGSRQPVEFGSAGSSILPLTEPKCTTWRTALLSLGRSNAFSIRNSAWTLRGNHAFCRSQDTDSEHSITDEEVSPQLFVRPDDRWEANDIAKLCPDVVDELRVAVTTAFRQLQNGEVPSLLKLPD